MDDDAWMDLAYRTGYEHGRDGLPPRVPLDPVRPSADVIDLRQWAALRQSGLNR